MLEDGDFSGAMSKCDTLLDSDPTNGRVYFFMLMSSLQCRKRSELANQPARFDSNQYYIKAVKYGDSSLKAELAGYLSTIDARNEAKRKREIEENEAKRKREIEENAAKLKNPKVGDEIYFGTENGPGMCWKVLKIQDRYRMALIISKDIVCNMPYHEPGGNITWSDSSLRKWLNDKFINKYFTRWERGRIRPCQLNNDNNPGYNTPGGVPTTDKVFLLSLNEANTLFADDKARANGSSWWLRTPGTNPDLVLGVSEYGKVYAAGGSVATKYCGVRPALWLVF